MNLTRQPQQITGGRNVYQLQASPLLKMLMVS